MSDKCNTTFVYLNSLKATAIIYGYLRRALDAEGLHFTMRDVECWGDPVQRITSRDSKECVAQPDSESAPHRTSRPALPDHHISKVESET